MPSLVCDGAVIAPAEVAYTRRARLRGLLGRRGVNGAFVLPGVKGVHTFGMRFPIDVAFVDRRGRVLDVVTMRRHRMTRSRWRAAMVVEAEAGALDGWAVRKGSRLEIR